MPYALRRYLVSFRSLIADPFITAFFGFALGAVMVSDAFIAALTAMDSLKVVCQ